MHERPLPQHLAQSFKDSESNLLIAEATWLALSRFAACSDLLEDLTMSIVVQISRDMGGVSHYITKRTADVHDIKRRNASIREAFDGSNIKALAMRFGVSEVTIKNILKSSRQSAKTMETVAASEKPFQSTVTGCNREGAGNALAAFPVWMNTRPASKK